MVSQTTTATTVKSNFASISFTGKEYYRPRPNQKNNPILEFIVFNIQAQKNSANKDGRIFV